MMNFPLAEMITPTQRPSNTTYVEYVEFLRDRTAPHKLSCLRGAFLLVGNQEGRA